MISHFNCLTSVSEFRYAKNRYAGCRGTITVPVVTVRILLLKWTCY